MKSDDSAVSEPNDSEDMSTKDSEIFWISIGDSNE